MSLTQGFSEYITGSKITIQYFFQDNLIILFFTFFPLVFILFYKKEFSKKYIFAVFLFFIIVNCFLYYKTSAYPNPSLEIHYYSIVFWFIFPTIIFIILQDYFKFSFITNNKGLYSNLLVIACFAGISNLCWQINSFRIATEYSDYLKDIANKEEGVLVYIPREDFSKYKFLRFNSCFGITHKMLFLSDKYEINKIIMPSVYFDDYSPYCFADTDKTYYDALNGLLYLQTAKLNVKSKYWDLTAVAKEFARINRLKTDDIPNKKTCLF